MRWLLVTGEYPPQSGGVGDYTRAVAGGLAAAGDAVTVAAPPAAGPPPDDPGVRVVRLPDHYGPRGLFALDWILHARPVPDAVVVQYVPHAFGMRGVNLPFAAWLAARGRRATPPVWVMFHEVALPMAWRPARRAAAAVAQRAMARLAAGAAARVFVSIPGWGPLLKRVCPRARPAEWLPVPSNVGTAADPAAVASVCAEYAPGGGPLVGHFGTFGGPLTDILGPTLAATLRATGGAAAVLMGRGGPAFRAAFVARFPEVGGRVRATGELPADRVAAHLRACDLLLQPYPDGISGRRTSAMAGLANGVPVVTNLGALSEPLWANSGGVAAAPAPDPAAVAAVAAGLLADPDRRAAVGRAGSDLYDRTFALRHTVAALRRRAGG